MAEKNRYTGAQKKNRQAEDGDTILRSWVANGSIKTPKNKYQNDKQAIEKSKAACSSACTHAGKRGEGGLASDDESSGESGDC